VGKFIHVISWLPAHAADSLERKFAPERSRCRVFTVEVDGCGDPGDPSGVRTHQLVDSSSDRRPAHCITAVGEVVGPEWCTCF
jgi:hypothetical protein